MRAFVDILRAADSLSFEQQQSARLATVVHVEGSTYARAGCRLLCASGEPIAGYISGGCLERDLARRSQLIHEPTVVTYDTRPGGEAEEFNLGCDGVIHLLVEPLVSTHDALAPLRSVVQQRVTVDGAIVFRGPEVGGRLEIDPHLDEPWQREARAMLETGNGVVVEGDRAIFVERLTPMARLVVLGAGHDAGPLVSVALAAGFEVHVVDPNPRRTAGEAAGWFDGATVECRDFKEAIEAMRFDEQTAAVLMTHDQSADALALPPLLQSGALYVGLLGPKRRTARLMTELHTAGVRFPADQLEKLHTPVGLDLGGGSPEDIAVSIVAEIIATRNGRQGGKLSGRMAPIHDEMSVVRVVPAPVQS